MQWTNQVLHFDQLGSIAPDSMKWIAKGGEGRVYKIFENGSPKYVAKLYLEPNKVKDDGLLEKIKLLRVFNSPLVISPKGFIRSNKDDDKIIGYWMMYSEGDGVQKLITNKGRSRHNITDEDIILLVDRMRQVVKLMHAYRCLLIDANERNWRFIRTDNGLEPRLLDVDAVTTRHWNTKVVSPDIEDFHSDFYSKDTDWFAWAVVTFRLFTGIHPYGGMLSGYDEKSPSVLQDRMKANASIFKRGVAYNKKMVRDFSRIPPHLLVWYRKVFDNGYREAPPTLITSSLQIPLIRPLKPRKKKKSVVDQEQIKQAIVVGPMQAKEEPKKKFRFKDLFIKEVPDVEVVHKEVNFFSKLKSVFINPDENGKNVQVDEKIIETSILAENNADLDQAQSTKSTILEKEFFIDAEDAIDSIDDKDVSLEGSIDTYLDKNFQESEALATELLLAQDIVLTEILPSKKKGVKIRSDIMKITTIFAYEGISVKNVLHTGYVYTQTKRLINIDHKYFVHGEFTDSVKSVRINEDHVLFCHLLGDKYEFILFNEARKRSNTLTSSFEVNELTRVDDCLYWVSSIDRITKLHVDLDSFMLLKDKKSVPFNSRETIWYQGLGVRKREKGVIDIICLKEDGYKKISTKRLVGVDIIDAISSEGFIALMGKDRKGDVKRFECSFYPDYSHYSWWVERGDLNIATVSRKKKSNVNVSIESNGLLEIYVPFNGGITLVEDKNIHSDDVYCFYNELVCFIRSGNVYSMTMP